jgi:hypothetical protein
MATAAKTMYFSRGHFFKLLMRNGQNDGIVVICIQFTDEINIVLMLRFFCTDPRVINID